MVGAKAVDARGDDAKCLERGRQWRSLGEGVTDRVGMGGEDDDLDVREKGLLPVPRLGVRGPRILVDRQIAKRLHFQPLYADLGMFAFLAVLRAWAVLAFVALRQEALDEARLSGRHNVGDIPADPRVFLSRLTVWYRTGPVWWKNVVEARMQVARSEGLGKVRIR